MKQLAKNKFSFVHTGKQVTLTPLSPSEVCEDQIKMRVKREQERKEEKNKIDEKKEKHERRENEEYGGYKPIPMQKKTLHQENL